VRDAVKCLGHSLSVWRDALVPRGSPLTVPD
jgi:hypothetical protein